MESKSFLLEPAVQNYAWGKPGYFGVVAQLAVTCIPNFLLDDDETYAELWMGTHPKGPSKVAETGLALSKWLEQNPECVGEKVKEAFSTQGQLPFLLKVLSVFKALSIQAHPNKEHAEKLHRDKPDKYPDSNHKPEMAIAINRFEGLCGFRPKQEILHYFKRIPELTTIIGESLVNEFENSTTEEDVKSSLQKCFTALMTCDENVVSTQIKALHSRLWEKVERNEELNCHQSELFLRLNIQHPGDVGCFVTFFLNHIILKPGEAMFLEANVPHAYLCGDIIECMACSDNVVRAGLTPKFKDVSTLCEMLNYSGKPAAECKFLPETDERDQYIQVFKPPIPDFTVARIELPAKVRGYQLQKLESASILLVVEGSASISSISSPSDGPFDVRNGSVLFISAHESLSVNVSDEDSRLLMFRAYCQV